MKETEPDDLQQLWQAHSRLDTEAHRLEPVQLVPLLQGRTHHALRKMRQNVLLEAVLGLAIMAVLGWLGFRLPDLRWACWTAGLLFSCFYGLYYRNFRQLQAAEQATGSLRVQLSHALTYWQKALRLYVGMNMALLPPFFLVGALLGAHEAGRLALVQSLFAERWYFWLPLLFLLTWAMYPLVRWLVWLAYGRHLAKLKNCLSELERTENE